MRVDGSPWFVALPKYHFSGFFSTSPIMLGIVESIHRGLVPTWDPKSSMTFRVRNPRKDPGTQIIGENSVEDSSAEATTAANFGTLTQEFLPTGR